MWQINALCFAKQFLPMLAVQLDLKPEAAAPRHGDLPFSALRCGVPSIPPALGKGRKVTRGWFFIPTHSNPTAVEMLAPEYGSQRLSLQVHWACILGDSALISCAPVPAAAAGPGLPTPSPFGQQLSQQTDPKQPGNCLSIATFTKALNGSFYGVTAVLQKRLQRSSLPSLGQGMRAL